MATDPVCGMLVDERTTVFVEHQGQNYYFCSPVCRDLFLKEPQHYTLDFQARERQRLLLEKTVAYFSMEIGIESSIPTYSGGLGVLAGDTLRSCADLKVPIVAVTLLYHHGYFRQELDEWGTQHELPVHWEPQKHLKRLTEQVQVTIERRPIKVGAWRYDITGVNGFAVPVIFLDTDLPGNTPQDRDLSGFLYGGDQRYRLMQEAILGIAGVRMLRALGYSNIRKYHMNEGHASLLVLELLREMHREPDTPWQFNGVKHSCVFTTHTPVPAAYDRFPYELVESVLGGSFPTSVLQMLAGKDVLNMTLLALNASHYVNGVAKRHGEVSREMFSNFSIDSITNGVHSYTWACDSFRELYDRHIPGWSKDPFTLRYSLGIPAREIIQAHRAAKQALIEYINQRTHAGFDAGAFTIGFARRATQYKRTDLILHDLDRLQRLAAKHPGGLQLVFAGKAHPRDQAGKDLIRRVAQVSKELHDNLRIVYLPDYDMAMARMIVSGVDLWLNTPKKPMEASGTSGMKAALNGVPSLSVLDGWWLEGHIEGTTGWSIGSPEPRSADDATEAHELYDKLEYVIIPLYHVDSGRWVDVMRHAIAINASFFNTHRMVQQYVLNAYR